RVRGRYQLPRNDLDWPVFVCLWRPIERVAAPPPAPCERTMLIQAKELFRFWPITDGCRKVQEFLLRQRNPRYLSGGIANYTQAKGSVASRQGVAFGHVRGLPGG